MTKEKLFEFAVEKGWHEILEAAYHTHSLPALAGLLKKKENVLLVELRAMQGLGLLALTRKTGEGFAAYIPTFWGIKFMQEENKKRGRTFFCLLCGTTTGRPHVCPCFDSRFRE